MENSREARKIKQSEETTINQLVQADPLRQL